MRLLGLDYGARRVGVALGDTESCIASPWKVLEYTNASDLMDQLHALTDEEGIRRFVVGVPRPLSDSSHENAQVQEVRHFIEQLRAGGFDVEEIDETLTSKMAAGYTQAQGIKGKRDDVAASVILQSWLDRTDSSCHPVEKRDPESELDRSRFSTG